MTLNEILFLVKVGGVLGVVGYIAFLYFSRKSLKSKVKDKETTIESHEKEIELLKGNVDKLNKYSSKRAVTKKNTEEAKKVIDDKEKTEDEKDKVMADRTSDFLSGR